VFLLNSRHPLLCATRSRLPASRSRLSRSYASNLPSSFDIVLSSASVCSTSPPVSVSGTVYTLELFPGTLHQHGQSVKPAHSSTFVTSSRPRNVDLVPIGYGSRPRLRGRLTLRGLTLRRNPWTFGDRVSHSVSRYSCQHSHLPYLHRLSRTGFTGLGNAPLPSSCQLSVFSGQTVVLSSWFSQMTQQTAQHARDLVIAILPGAGTLRLNEAEVARIRAPQLRLLHRAQRITI
jgi:hypothetical protein